MKTALLTIALVVAPFAGLGTFGHYDHKTRTCEEYTDASFMTGKVGRYERCFGGISGMRESKSRFVRPATFEEREAYYYGG